MGTPLPQSQMRDMAEMPQISASAYTTSTYGGGDMVGQNFMQMSAQGYQGDVYGGGAAGGIQDDIGHRIRRQAALAAPARPMLLASGSNIIHGNLIHPIEEADDMANAQDQDRLVRVIIVDTNKSIPAERRVLHKSEEFFTELSDQELFFEADPVSLLKKHNEYRTTVHDKSSGEKKSKNLEPARIRDLHMAVVTVARF